MKKRPIGITIIAILNIMSIVAKIITVSITSATLKPGMVFFSIVFIALQLVVCIGFFKGWYFSYIIALGGLGFKFIASLLSLFSAKNLLDPLVGLIITGLLLAYLIFPKNVKDFFTKKNIKNQNPNKTDSQNCVPQPEI